MTLAENIRKYVVDHLIEPARKNGKSMVTVNANDVHEALGLEYRYPVVCSALDSDKFLIVANVTIVKRTGPRQSSTVSWVFGL